MRAATFLRMLSAGACTFSRAPFDNCAAHVRINGAVEFRRSTFDEIKPRYLKTVDIDSLPAVARRGVIDWVDKEVARLSAERKTGDEIFYFREEKCANCHWFREGYILIRGCDIVDEITLSDDM
jgi:hypothetical protein